MYDADFKQSGAKIGCNLLESSRVFAAKLNESNFHIFYTLVLGAPNEILEDIGLDQQISYNVCSTCDSLKTKKPFYKFQLIF